MIGIGINEYVILSNQTKVNEKGTLELHLKTGKISDEEMIKLLEKGVDVGESSTKLLLFAPLTKTFEGSRKTAQQLAKDMQDHIKLLSKFLEVYLAKEKIEELFSPAKIIEMSGVSAQAYLNGLKNDEFISGLYTKIAKKFVEVINKEGIVENKNSFRLKLWRQSATKNFPRIPTGFDTWIEPMNVPTPKVVATTYDLTPFTGSAFHKLSTDAPLADAVPQVEQKKAEELFEPDTSVNTLFTDDGPIG
jgi:hypothetical protein